MELTMRVRRLRGQLKIGWLAVESKPRYRSSSEAYRRILAEEGFREGLYRGYFPNLIRNSVISATELVSIIPLSSQINMLRLATLSYPSESSHGPSFMAAASTALIHLCCRECHTSGHT